MTDKNNVFATPESVRTFLRRYVEILESAMARKPECWICGKPKGRLPEGCPGHYEGVGK